MMSLSEDSELHLFGLVLDDQRDLFDEKASARLAASAKCYQFNLVEARDEVR